MMSRLSILLLVSALFLTPAGGHCAGDCRAINNSGVKADSGPGDVLCTDEQDPFPSSPPSESKQKPGGDDNAVFSGYPETFIIPKGVCERNEPVMEIKKRDSP